MIWTPAQLFFLACVAVAIALLVVSSVLENVEQWRVHRCRAPAGEENACIPCGRSPALTEIGRKGEAMNTSSLTDELDMLLFDYVARANPKSNEDLKRYLRCYPQYREEIIEFTANWRALSIVEKVMPPPDPDPVAKRQMLRQAQARLRALRRRRTSQTAI